MKKSGPTDKNARPNVSLGMKASQTTSVSHTQIFALQILKLPQEEMEQQIQVMKEKNPAILADDIDMCPVCNYPLKSVDGSGCQCVHSAKVNALADDTHLDGGEPWEVSSHSTRTNQQMEDDDPVARIASHEIQGSGIITALHALIERSDYMIADYLVGSMDHHGLLPEDIISETTNIVCVEKSHVEEVLRKLQSLDPPGIGARTPKESIMLQLTRLNPRNELAETIVSDYFIDLAQHHFRVISSALGITPRQVELTLTFLAQHISPYPAHGYDPDLAGITEGAPTIRPDVVIRQGYTGFEVDVVEQRRWEIGVSPFYLEARKKMRRDTNIATVSDREHVRSFVDQANNFVSALHQRWTTIRRVAEALVQLQSDFVEHGTSGLKPLTRKDVGAYLELHESTVSRATDGKFILMPNGRTIPFDDFFDNSLLIKDAIKDIIESENPRHPYSDQDLRKILLKQGHDVARRTIAKYRDELEIFPSRLRRNRVSPVSASVKTQKNSL